MKAIISPKSGPPEILQYRDIEKPVPQENDILIKVHASTVTIGDVFLRKISRLILIPVGILFGFKPKKITGTEFAGEVEAHGKNVQRFNVGDQVFGTTTGLTVGGNAEYVCVPEVWKHGVVAIKPTNLSYAESAAIPVGGMTALYILKRANIKSGQKVLIYGASGSVGTYAVQLAKHYGAEVTGVCSSDNMNLVKSIGADNVIDYTKDDFSQSESIYDVVFDAVGKIGKSQAKKVLVKNGIFLSVKYPTTEKQEDFNYLKNLIEEGKIKPVIDKYYTLDQAVEAHKYVETGRKKGNVIINICS